MKRDEMRWDEIYGAAIISSLAEREC